MPPKRPTEWHRVSAVATCDGCGFRVVGAGAQGNAARHYDSTGHTVRVAQETLVVYGGQPHPDRPTLLDALDDTANA